MLCKAQTAVVAGLRRGFATRQSAKIREFSAKRGIVQRFPSPTFHIRTLRLPWSQVFHCLSTRLPRIYNR